MVSAKTANVKQTLGRIMAIVFLMSTLVVVGIAAGVSAKSPAKGSGPAVFPSPEAAVEALATALKSGDETALLAIFGKAGKDLIASGDAVADRNAREQFLRMYETRHQLSSESDRMMALEVGQEHWPFPIPLVRKGQGWCFDTRLGKEEIINRRIGRNELNAVQVCHAYVDAQHQYAAKDRDGDGVLEYAQRVVSNTGQQDGLFWPEAEGREASPLGPLFARAQQEGYRSGPSNPTPTPYHGYYYRILKAQGKHAPGGVRDYAVKGNMIGGFALVAYPARYGGSGIMTFVVSHNGVVYQKNLGPKTHAALRAMTRFDPDPTWQKVP